MRQPVSFESSMNLSDRLSIGSQKVEHKTEMMAKIAVTLMLLLTAACVGVASAHDDSRDLAAPGEIDFFFMGDWGHNVPANESESGVAFEGALVAHQMNLLATKVKPKFIAPMGDNFYDNGVASTTDPLWKAEYATLYTAPATFVPWYPVMGNHDYFGAHNPQAQIDYYYEGKDSRWTFPDYQYTRTFPIPGTKQTMEVVFINTVTLCPETETANIGFPANPNNQFPNPDPASRNLNNFIWQPTHQWISNTLAASKADLLLVVGHYHIYTNTIVDVSYTPEATCLQQRLVPLLKQHGVTAYINGHEHNFEHFIVDGISYYTAGHGCDKDDPISPNTKPLGLMYNKTVGGFGWAKVQQNKLTVNFIDLNGNQIYTHSTGFRKPHRSLRSQEASD